MASSPEVKPRSTLSIRITTRATPIIRCHAPTFCGVRLSTCPSTLRTSSISPAPLTNNSGLLVNDLTSRVSLPLREATRSVATTSLVIPTTRVPPPPTFGLTQLSTSNHPIVRPSDFRSDIFPRLLCASSSVEFLSSYQLILILLFVALCLWFILLYINLS